MARSSYRSSDPPKDKGDWEPAIDKNPFYRTNDILNSVFKKKMKIDQAPVSKTDCQKMIYVNFNEKIYSQVKAVIFEDPGNKTEYLLECGHKWKGRNKMEIGKTLKCNTCSERGAYLSFCHEWQHNYFKSNPIALSVLIDEYFEREIKGKYNVSEQEAKTFIFLFFNAFDDIRVNSLDEKYHPGTAHALWERWRYHLGRVEYNSNFLAYTLAIGLGLPVDPQSPFANLEPVISWAMAKVRYTGFAKAMLIAKAALEKCVGAILANVPPPPPQQQQQAQQPQQQPGDGQDDQQQAAGSTGNQDSAGTNQASGAEGDQEEQGDEGVHAGAGGEADEGDGGGQEAEEEDGGGEGSDQDQVPQAGGTGQPEPVEPPSNIPSAGEVQTTNERRTSALQQLMTGAKNIDNTQHHSPSPEEIQKDPAQALTQGIVGTVLGSDTTDLEALDAMIGDEIDADMQRSLDQLQNGMSTPSVDSMLTGGARAKILFIDVEPHHVSANPILLTSEENFAIERMRAAFFKALGKVKTQVGESGPCIDPEKAIQALISPAGIDPDIFPADFRNQGFCYHVLTDMSGSMYGERFRQVVHAVEMLKEALDFPFVNGELWGFRGTEYGHEPSCAGEVWLYRYSKRCRSYTGSREIFHPSLRKRLIVPVECGGITPMNQAIRATTACLGRQPEDTAKRLFLLTDGSPIQTRVTGRSLPDFLLRQFVRDAIVAARQKGIQVFTLLIGNTGLSDEMCLYMFGPRQYWRVVGTTGEDSVDRVLQRLVIDNFQKYIKARA